MAYTAKNPTLSRKAASKKALLVSLSNALLKHKRIQTTLAKAKALGRYIAPILTNARARSASDRNHAYRQAFSILRDKRTIPILFEEVLPQIGNRPGGYTRIIKLGPRRSDGANMAYIELVDFNLLYSAAKKKTRRKRSKTKQATTTETTKATQTKQVETTSNETKTNQSH